MDLQLDVVVFEILFHLFAIDVVDVQVGDCKASTPLLVAVGEIVVLDIENSIDEGEIVLDLLVALNVKANMASRIFGLRDRCFHIRHFEGREEY